MRVVLDTNAAVSALLWGGLPEQLLAAHADLIVSGDAGLLNLKAYQGSTQSSGATHSHGLDCKSPRWPPRVDPNSYTTKGNGKEGREFTEKGAKLYAKV